MVSPRLQSSIIVNNNPQNITNAIETSLKYASGTVLGKRQSNNKADWITTNTHDEIAAKHRIRKKYGPRSIKYKLAKSTVKKMCKIDKQNHIDQMHKEFSNLPGTQQYYKAVKSLKLSNMRTVTG